MNLFRYQEGEGGNCNSINVSLQAISEQLQTLQLQIFNLDTTYDRLKEENNAAREKGSSLWRELQFLQEQVHLKNDLEEKCVALQIETGHMNEQNISMQSEIRKLKVRCEGVRALDESYNAARANRELISQKNDALLKEIDELYTELQHEKALHNKFDEMKELEESMSRQYNSLQQELRVMQEKWEREKLWGDLSRDRLGRINTLKEENYNLQLEIQRATRRLQTMTNFKAEHEGLQAEEKVLQARSKILGKMHQKTELKLRDEEVWRQKHKLLIGQIDALKQETRTVTSGMKALHQKDACHWILKADYLSTKAEQEVLTDLNNTLKKEFKKLEKKLSKEHDWEKKIDAKRTTNQALSKENQALKLQVQRLRNSLQGEEVLTSSYKTLMEEKKALCQQNDSFYREIQELIKKEEKQEKLKEGKAKWKRDRFRTQTHSSL